MSHFGAQNGPAVLNKIFLVQTVIITFILPTDPYHCTKFKKKNSYSRSIVMRMHHFGAQNGPFALNSFFFFFGKNY